jgi:hypothetical protein
MRFDSDPFANDPFGGAKPSAAPAPSPAAPAGAADALVLGGLDLGSSSPGGAAPPDGFLDDLFNPNPLGDAVALDTQGAWGRAFRSADLGVADGTTDEATRVAALKRFGLGGRTKAELKQLIAKIRP